MLLVGSGGCDAHWGGRRWGVGARWVSARAGCRHSSNERLSLSVCVLLWTNSPPQRYYVFLACQF